MYNIQANNTPNFLGARELVSRDVIKNGKKLGKPIQEIISQSQLRTATEELMQDLNSLAISNFPIEKKVDMNEVLSTQAIKSYESSTKELKIKK